MDANGNVRLGFAGDTWLRSSDPRLGSGASADLFGSVRDWVAACEIACLNLECFVSDPEDQDDRRFWKAKTKHLSTHPELLRVLRNAGFDLVNLANNHVLDGGAPGLERTMAAIDAVGLKRVGAGRNRTEAVQAVPFLAGGLRLAYVAAAEWPEDAATPDHPGTASTRPTRQLVEQVRQATEAADVVVVQLHADLEFTVAPAPYRVNLARRLIDAGATMVIQHHPHVLQGVERYRGGLIAYSLGNFAFPITSSSYQRDQEGVRDGGWLEVDLDSEGRIADWRVRPVHIGDSDLPCRPDPDKSSAILQRIHVASELLQDPGHVRRRWGRRCRSELRYHIMMIYYRLRRYRFAEAVLYALKLPAQRRNWRWFLGGVATRLF